MSVCTQAGCDGTVDEDGYCDECGRPTPGTGDHVEIVLAPAREPAGSAPRAAGVSDRGHHRRRNEDSFALGRCHTVDGREAVVAVVTDGVASVPDGDAASRTAGTAAVAAATEALGEGEHPRIAAATAVEAARQAVAALAPSEGRPPACTYVAALVVGSEAVVSWVGDSRAYWLAPGASRLLTEDDSWASEMVAAGMATAESVHRDPRSHVITRWLAADAPDVGARSVEIDLDASGVLLLCSDGIWNHLPAAETLEAVLGYGSDRSREASGHGSGASPPDPDDVSAGSRALVRAALDDGGTDNATAVLVAAGPAVGDAGESRSAE